MSHHAQITDDELARIEELTNEQIHRNLPVYAEVREQSAARKINTLRAVFGEKYPDEVRVVSIGVPVDDLLADPDNEAWMKYSVEFCGGTHVKTTGEIGKFRLIEESAVAKGVRRVVGITAERAQQAEAAALSITRQLAEAAEADDAALPERIAEITSVMNQTELPVVERNRLRVDLAKLQERAKKIQKQAAKAGAADVTARADELLAAAEKIGPHHLIVGRLTGATVDQLRAACDSLRARAKSAAVFLASDHDDKATLLAGMTVDLVGKGIKAGDVVKAIAPMVGGKGGGRPDMAQGGGPDIDKIDDALQDAAGWLRTKLNE